MTRSASNDDKARRPSARRPQKAGKGEANGARNRVGATAERGSGSSKAKSARKDKRAEKTKDKDKDRDKAQAKVKGKGEVGAGKTKAKTKDNDKGKGKTKPAASDAAAAAAIPVAALRGATIPAKPSARRVLASQPREIGSPRAARPARGASAADEEEPTVNVEAIRGAAERAARMLRGAPADDAAGTMTASAEMHAMPVEASTPAATSAQAQAPVDEQLREIQQRIEDLRGSSYGMAGDRDARRRAAAALGDIAASLGNETAKAPTATDDFYARTWGRDAMRGRYESVDDFGLDPGYESRMRPLFELLYEKWFRVKAWGIEQVPAEGRALIVCNHSGVVPLDGAMLSMALRLEHSAHRQLRWLTEDVVFHMPFLGPFLNRIGAVRACPENAERLLKTGSLVAVFPEGIQGIGKLYRERYKLQRFGRGGYVKLALRTRTPIIPVAVIGAEESSPMLFKVSALAKLMKLPYLPVTPTFPLLGPLGLVPLPTRWSLLFGPPIDLSDHGPEAADDAVLVNRLNDQVRSTIQTLIDQGLSARTSIF
jgi:1-acyl-sn-glycerol-3-phosphate acyltransferase